MLIRFHFADTLFATSFIRSDSSGSLSSPAYLLPEPASEESVKIPATVVRCYMVLPDGGRKQWHGYVVFVIFVSQCLLMLSTF